MPSPSDELPFGVDYPPEGWLYMGVIPGGSVVLIGWTGNLRNREREHIRANGWIMIANIRANRPAEHRLHTKLRHSRYEGLTPTRDHEAYAPHREVQEQLIAWTRDPHCWLHPKAWELLSDSMNRWNQGIPETALREERQTNERVKRAQEEQRLNTSHPTWEAVANT